MLLLSHIGFAFVAAHAEKLNTSNMSCWKPACYSLGIHVTSLFSLINQLHKTVTGQKNPLCLLRRKKKKKSIILHYGFAALFHHQQQATLNLADKTSGLSPPVHFTEGSRTADAAFHRLLHR